MKEKEDFNRYVENFKKLTIDKKKSTSIKELKEILAFIMMLQKKYNIPEDILYNREIVDANNDYVSEDDYVEAVFVYTYIIKEAFAEYVAKTMNKLEEL